MAEQSTERVKRWTIYVCPRCGRRQGGNYSCWCDCPGARWQRVEVIPADAPNVLSVEEARLLWKYATTHNIASDRILNRLRTFAEEADRD